MFSAVGESDLAGARGEDSELGEGGVEEGGGGKQEAGAGEHEEAVEHVLGEGVGWGAINMARGAAGVLCEVAMFAIFNT